MGARGGTCQEGVWLGESGGAGVPYLDSDSHPPQLRREFSTEHNGRVFRVLSPLCELQVDWRLLDLCRAVLVSLEALTLCPHETS